MLAVSHHPSSSVFPSIHFGAMDDSGTINPAALNCKHPVRHRGDAARPVRLRAVAFDSSRATNVLVLLLTNVFVSSIYHRTESTHPAESKRREEESVTRHRRRHTRSRSWYV